MLLILLTLVTAIATYFIKLYWTSRDYWRKVSAIPGETPLPIIGNALSLGFTPADLTKSITRMWLKFNRKTFKVLVGYQPLLFISTVDVLEIILGSSTMIEKPYIYNFLRPWLGEGLLMANESKWHSRRKIISPVFHFSVLEQFVAVFNQEAAILARVLETKAGTGGFDICELASRATLGIISETALGIKLHPQEQTSPIVEATKEICAVLHTRMFSTLKQSDWVFNMTSDGKRFFQCKEILQKFTKNVIEQRRKEIKSEIDSGFSNLDAEDIGPKPPRKSLLDILLLSITDDGRRLTDEDIREEVDTFMFAGNDASSSGIVFLLYELANNQAVQDKVYYEIIRVMGGRDEELNFTMKNLSDMKYLELVIKEVFRLHPPVPLFARKLSEDIKTKDGLVLPSGCVAVMAPMLLHMNPDYFEDPERFLPERFLPDNFKMSNPYSYLPFSAGCRNCMGQKYAIFEIKTVVCWLVRKYKLLPQPGYKPTKTVDIIMKTGNGVIIKIEKRK